MPIGTSELLIVCALAGAVAMLALLTRPRADKPYRALQFAGWMLYGFAKYSTGTYTIPRVVLTVAVGFAISLAINAVIDRMFARGIAVPKIILASTLVAPLAAYVWLVAYNGVTLKPAFAIVSAQGLLNKTLALLAWTGVHIGIRLWTALGNERASAAEAQLAALRYQLNPHFLFNALNSVSAMVDEEPARAKQMVRDLSDFLRDALRGGTSDVPLADEVASVERYLGIEKIRFEDRLVFDVRVDPAAAKALVPGFLLHPLVENAVKYGMKTSPMPLRIALTAERNNGSLWIEVRNSGAIASNGDGEGFGIGVENVRRRLAKRFPGRHAFAVAEDAGCVAARMEIRE